MSDVGLGWEEVTPERAERWLGHVIDGNRRVSSSAVEAYAHDMAVGQWVWDNPQPIVFDDEMRLIDGQHRLSAVVASRVTARFLIVRGAPDSALAVIDRGRKRNLADTLHMRGAANASALATVGRAAMLWDQGKRGIAIFQPNEPVTQADVIKFIDEHPELAHNLVLALRTQKALGGMASSVYGLACWLCNKSSASHAAEFFAQLGSGANLQERSPVLTLRERIRKEHGEMRKTPRHIMLAYFILAWNAYVKGQPKTLLRWFPDQGDFPEPVSMHGGRASR